LVAPLASCSLTRNKDRLEAYLSDLLRSEVQAVGWREFDEFLICRESTPLCRITKRVKARVARQRLLHFMLQIRSDSCRRGSSKFRSRLGSRDLYVSQGARWGCQPSKLASMSTILDASSKLGDYIVKGWVRSSYALTSLPSHFIPPSRLLQMQHAHPPRVLVTALL
jgi:hypothetical protein